MPQDLQETFRLLFQSENCYAEHKADENHPEVSAKLSIIAKVTRDNCVKQLSQELNMDLGSGYPSDPKTKAAVKILSIGEYPHDCLRWSWKTVSDARGSPVPQTSGWATTNLVLNNQEPHALTWTGSRTNQLWT